MELKRAAYEERHKKRENSKQCDWMSFLECEESQKKKLPMEHNLRLVSFHL